MSDRRAKYIILASIMFVGIVGISQGQGLFESNDVKSTASTSSFAMLGHVTSILKDPAGNIKAYQQADNKVVNIGRDCASNLVFGTAFGLGTFTCDLVQFIAIGSSTAPVVDGNTALFDKTTNGNVKFTSTSIIDTATALNGIGLTLDYETTFTILAADAGETIGETGLFDSENTMFARTAFLPGVPVTEDDSLTIKWALTVD